MDPDTIAEEKDRVLVLTANRILHPVHSHDDPETQGYAQPQGRERKGPVKDRTEREKRKWIKRSDFVSGIETLGALEAMRNCITGISTKPKLIKSRK